MSVLFLTSEKDFAAMENDDIYIHLGHILSVTL